MKTVANIITIAAASLALTAVPAHGALNFTGLSQPVFQADAQQSSAIEAVYVLPQTDGVRISYAATSDRVVWYRYSTPSNPDNMTEVPGVTRDGNVYSIPAQAGDVGYVIHDGTTQHYYWVTNYVNHRLQLTSLSVSAESACDRVVLDVAGSGDEIRYYTVSGRPYVLPRDLKLEYNTLEFDSEQNCWNTVPAVSSQQSVHALMSVQAPLCNTEFTLSGDRFLEFWGETVSVSTPLYTATAVSVETTAEQQSRDNDNEIKPDAGALGGSAPCGVNFKAYPTDAAIFREWQFSYTEDFADIYQRYAQDELEYTFDEQGQFYVRFQCGDADGVCFSESPVYAIAIGESKLECPNAFSPNGDGTNDEWKVSYQSIVDFECHIFNRWGVKMADLTHPSQYRGKTVPSGVYFYVIKARGADGRQYNLSGDINILHSRRVSSGTSSGGGSEPEGE